MKHILSSLLIACLSLPAPASSDTPVDCRLSGRLFIDGGAYLRSPESLHSGIHITDLRLGAKVRILSSWYTKIDVGFAGNKVSLKDAYTEYGRGGNYFRAGYMLGFYSIDQSNSTNDFVFNTGANVAETFYPGRRIGVSYTRSLPAYYLSAGAFCGDGLWFSEATSPGYNLSARAVWRPVNASSRLLHVGAGALFRVPDEDTEAHTRQVGFASKGVTYLPSQPTLSLTATDAARQVQANVECLLFHDRWMLQTEYMYTGISREGSLPSYRAHGGYVVGGFLLRGTRYAYDPVDALPVMPEEPHTLLLVCRYNYTNLNDFGCGLTGGCQHDISVGVNYYFNKHISSRLNYAHLWLDGYSALGKCMIDMMQLRLQVRF